MTTPSVLPQKLWRPLAEIKNFVEKMPDGVRLTEVTKKVKTFAELSGKERNQLIDFIDKRESIIVFKVRKEGSGNRDHGRDAEYRSPVGARLFPRASRPGGTGCERRTERRVSKWKPRQTIF